MQQIKKNIKVDNLFSFFLYTLGRYSPVRRASEGSKSYNHGPLHEYQLLQKGINNNRNFLITPSQSLDNSISLPGKCCILPIYGWTSVKLTN